MANNAEIAARLLRGAADFFRHVGDQNPDLRPQMEQNAETYEAVAVMVEEDPTGEVVFREEGGEEQSA